MTPFNTDVDILKREPVLFEELHLPNQVLLQGSGATLAGGVLTITDGDFIVRKIGPGHVVHLSNPADTLHGGYEIVSVDSATEITVSVVRADTTDDAVPPPDSAADVTYRIATFAPQSEAAALVLTQMLGLQPGDPGSSLDSADLVDTDGLRAACVLRVIADVYGLWADGTDRGAFGRKSLLYRKLFDSARQLCRISIGTATDGTVDHVRNAGTFRLVRE
jgi:hypothetical protein